MGKTVEFDIYPRGGHVLREPMQQREQMKRNLDWFTKWLIERPGAPFFRLVEPEGGAEVRHATRNRLARHFFRYLSYQARMRFSKSTASATLFGGRCAPLT